MATTVFLVRHALHGTVDQVLVGRLPGVMLSERGRRQAQRLAAWFAGQEIGLVQASPRERARETAAAIADVHAVPCEIAPALDEIDLGEWTGRRFADLAADPRWQDWNTARSLTRPPGGESMGEVQARIVDHIERIRSRLCDGRAVLVSHGDVIKAALLHFLGRPVEAYHELDVAPASVSAIELGPAGATVSVSGRGEGR